MRRGNSDGRIASCLAMWCSLALGRGWLEDTLGPCYLELVDEGGGAGVVTRGLTLQPSMLVKDAQTGHALTTESRYGIQDPQSSSFTCASRFSNSALASLLHG